MGISIGKINNVLNQGVGLYNVVDDWLTNWPVKIASKIGESIFDDGRAKLDTNRKSPADIYTFISAFDEGYAKQSRFRIEMSLPRGALAAENKQATPSKIRKSNNSLNKNDKINIKCHTITIPRRGFETMQVKNNNLSYKLPYAISYEPVTFGFYADRNIDSLRFFDIWQSAVMNYSSNTMNFFNEYVSNVRLYMIDDEGHDVYGVELYECFPVNLSQIDMSYSNQNQLMNVNVTFSYKYFLTMNNTERFNRAF